MNLPSKLLEAIERLTGTVSPKRLQLASATLTDRYKTVTQAAVIRTDAIRTEDERLAYLLVRMPATYAALVHALRAAKRQFMPQSGDASVSDNDLLSDNGVAMETTARPGRRTGNRGMGSRGAFPGLRQLRLVERDGGLIGLGRQLCASSDSPALRQAEWIHSDLNGKFAEGTFDLVVASYSLGELSPAQRPLCLRQAWQRTRKLLVLVEPGTRAGFGCIHQARSELIALGATVVAPCPHRLACPMAMAGDWCHFAARVERTAMHRRIKGGELGHEDEKFSYLAATSLKANPAEQRIVRHPVYHSGFVEVQLCSADGIGKLTIGKSKKTDYRAARRAAWGDAWPE